MEIESNSTNIAGNDTGSASFSNSNASLKSNNNDTGNTHTLNLVNERNSLVAFTQLLTQNGFISTSMLLERLEPEFLQLIGLIGSIELFNKKIVKINTAAFYRQQKFNLIREESEGFSKLVLLLAESSSKSEGMDVNDLDVDVDVLFNRCLELIGFFELDPIKVLDIILDTFTFNLNKWTVFINLLKKFSFPASTVVSLLNFKLKYFQTPDQSTKIPFDSLFTMIAISVRSGVFTLEEIWSNLHVTEAETKCLYEKFKVDLTETSKKLGVINLNTTGNATNATTATTTGSNTDSLTEQFAQDSFTKALTALLSTSENSLNFKAHLLSALLYIGSSDSAYKIIQSSPHLTEMSPNIPGRICNILEHLLDTDGSKDKYTSSVVADSRSFFSNFNLVITEDSSKWINWIQYLPVGCLGRSPALYSKLCRFFSNTPDIFPTGFIQNHLIPAISFGSHDSLILSQELWYNILSKIPYSERYTYYGGWIDSLSFYSEFIRSSSITEARKVMRRLAKENVRQYGRLVAKVTHSNPVIVLPLIIDQLQAYDNIIAPVVDAFKFLTPLSFDVLIFYLLKSLSSPERDRLKEDGTNIASWLQNLAQFSASLFRKYYASLDLSPLLKYIYSQLIDDNCLDLVILQDLLTQMTGVDRPENWSEGVIEGMAGGPILLQQVKASSLQTTQPSRRVINRFKTALDNENLTFPLLIAIAQAADAAIYRMDYSHLKLVSSLVDTCNSALFQYVEVLKLLEIDDLCAVYNQNDSFILDLIVKNKLEHSVAFTLARTFKFNFSAIEPAIRAHFSIGNSENKFIPSEFLKIFWNSSLSSISVPLQRYQLEINRSQAVNVSLSEQLQNEMKGQVSNCGKYRDVLMKAKDGWFIGSEERNLITDAILKFALIPRLLLTPGDSIFSAKFIFLLHSLGPSHLSTLTLLSSIFDTPEKILSSLTEAESHCLGRFIQEILVVLQGWHISKEKYEREAIAAHLPGFMKRWSNVLSVDHSETMTEAMGSESDVVAPTIDVTEKEKEIDNITLEVDDSEDCGIVIEIEVEAGLTDTEMGGVEIHKMNITEAGEVHDGTDEDLSKVHEASSESKSEVIEDKSVETTTTATTTTTTYTTTKLDLHLNWEDFRHVFFKWHTKLNSTLTTLLKSKNYTSIRNSVIFLSHLSGGTFPKIDKMSDELEVIVGEIREKDGREDLKVLATRYFAMLTQNHPKLIKTHQFHICEPETVNVPLPATAPEKVKDSRDTRSKDKDKDINIKSKREEDHKSKSSKEKVSIELKRSASSSNVSSLLEPSEAKRQRHQTTVELVSSSRDRPRRDDRSSSSHDKDGRRNELWSDRRERDIRDVSYNRDSTRGDTSRSTRDSPRDTPRDTKERDVTRDVRDRDPPLSRESRHNRDSRDSRDSRDRDRDSRDRDSKDSRSTRRH